MYSVKTDYFIQPDNVGKLYAHTHCYQNDY